MEIRNNPSAWIPVESSAPAATNPSAAPRTESVSQSSDHATVSAAGADISAASPNSDVRWEKVAAVQQALAAGSYNVPAASVAQKIVDAMLGAKN